MVGIRLTFLGISRQFPKVVVEFSSWQQRVGEFQCSSSKHLVCVVWPVLHSGHSDTHAPHYSGDLHSLMVNDVDLRPESFETCSMAQYIDCLDKCSMYTCQDSTYIGWSVL